jgi:hypothetical protein
MIWNYALPDGELVTLHCEPEDREDEDIERLFLLTNGENVRRMPSLFVWVCRESRQLTLGRYDSALRTEIEDETI